MGVYEPLKSGDTVWGPRERRGWSGSAVKDLAISENGFCPSHAPTWRTRSLRLRLHDPRLRAGPDPGRHWAVELGLAAIAPPPGDPDGVAWRVRVETSSDASWSDRPYDPVPYDSTPASTEPGWYVGDLHAHGEEEPGNATMKQTFDYGFAPISQGGAGLDFMTLVDHNNNVAHVGEIGRHQPDYPGKLIIPGTEVTTYKGHYNNQGSSHFADFRGGPVYLFDESDVPLTKIQDPVAPSEPVRGDPGGRRLDPDQPPDGPRRVASAAAAPGIGPTPRPTTRSWTRSRSRTGRRISPASDLRTRSRPPRSPSTRRAGERQARRRGRLQRLPPGRRGRRDPR